jgi:hypothetical protein
MRRWSATCWLFLVIGCGPEVRQTQNKVMENWPQAPANEVAGAAVGAAVLMTLANPDSARKPEAVDDGSKLKTSPTPQMPASLLDHQSPADDSSTKPAPCAPREARPPVPAWIAPDPGADAGCPR